MGGVLGYWFGDLARARRELWKRGARKRRIRKAGAGRAEAADPEAGRAEAAERARGAGRKRKAVSLA